MIFRTSVLAFWLLFSHIGGSYADFPVFPAPSEGNAVQTQLVTDQETAIRGEKIRIGMLYNIDSDWHIYWKNPGDSGLPTELVWQEGVPHDAEVFFPTPERISMANMMNYGYSGQTLIFSDVSVPKNAPDDWIVTAETSFLMCRDICLPGSATHTLRIKTVNAGENASPSPFKDIFDSYAAKSKIHALSGLKALYAPETQNIVLSWNGSSFEGDIYFIPEAESMIEDNAEQNILVERHLDDMTTPSTSIESDIQLIQSLSLLKDKFETSAPQTLSGLLVHKSLDGQVTNYAVKDIKVTPFKQKNDQLSKALANPENAKSHMSTSDKLEKPEVKENSTLTSLLGALIFAFIGGLVLNLMPCVLPVLSLKVMGLIHHKGEKNSWIFGLIYTAGILVTLSILASIFVAIKKQGVELGWGFQLQSPAFVATLTIILTLIALELLHVFEIGTTFGRIQNVLKSKNKVISTFLSGMLMTVVATPCTVPFMGGAVAYSLAQDAAFVTYIVFLSLGLGLAFPYLVLTISPQLSKFLPKPGAWESRLQEVLAFPMLATAVWLLWVYGKQTDVDSLAYLMVGLLTLSFGAWVYGHLGTLRSSALKKIMAFVIFYASLFFAVSTYNGHKIITETFFSKRGIYIEWNEEPQWLPWNSNLTTELQIAKQDAFIDFTADWCITCKVNKYAVLDRSEMIDFFNDKGILTIEADWTKRDPSIGLELKKYDHSGVPLYLAIHNGEVKVLPQLLTIQTVKDAYQ